MKILNLGSLNIDKVYGVAHFVTAGETIASGKMEVFCGGKGLNQSVALARAGATVYHAGAVGPDGGELVALLQASGARTERIQQLDTVSGHAIIQVTPAGQNAIIVNGGANHEVTERYIDEVLEAFGAGDFLLLQNEVACVDYAIRRGHERGMRVVLNPSPITAALPLYPLELVDVFVLNEQEAKVLCGKHAAGYEGMLAALCGRFPEAVVVLTVGKDGAYCAAGGEVWHHGIYDMPVVDTTGAGDTFCGYFLAALAAGRSYAGALAHASAASSITVSRKGAAPSIPTEEEVRRFMEEGALR